MSDARIICCPEDAFLYRDKEIPTNAWLCKLRDGTVMALDYVKIEHMPNWLKATLAPTAQS